ncbi:Transcription factor bHLH [Abeliophyllum distichum]|uniref:Transcription factor bHLH n=1 Tax=Abeliophyllum distichum TaxID=126358 RepID=A0ABD1VX55_9LAMI
MNEFPSQQNDDLVFHDPSVFQIDIGILEDLPGMSNSNLTIPKSSQKRQRKPSSGNQEKEMDEKKSRKLLHRDFERQRRQEMKRLYVSLRSLLPLEYIKGKRAVSDHMHESVNYIKDMQKNIKELSLRRDKLKKIYTSGSIGAEDGSSYSNYLPNIVTLSLCQDGVEVLINSRSRGGAFPLSRVLVELAGRSLNVVSCISTRTDDQRFLHRIQFEAMAGDITCIDLATLKHRLINVINLP